MFVYHFGLVQGKKTCLRFLLYKLINFHNLACPFQEFLIFSIIHYQAVHFKTMWPKINHYIIVFLALLLTEKNQLKRFLWLSISTIELQGFLGLENNFAKFHVFLDFLDQLELCYQSVKIIFQTWLQSDFSTSYDLQFTAIYKPLYSFQNPKLHGRPVHISKY